MNTPVRLIPARDYLAAQAHRPEPDPGVILLQLENLDRAIRDAAAAGDVGKVRQLRTQKRNIEESQEAARRARIEPMLEARRQREARRPARGEVRTLAERRRALVVRHDDLAREKQKLLQRLADVDDDALLSRAEEIDEQLLSAAESIEILDARLQQIEQWRQEQARTREQKAAEARCRKWDLECQQRRRDLEEIARQFAKKMRPCAAFFFDSEIQEKTQVQTNGSIVVEIRFEGRRKKY